MNKITLDEFFSSLGYYISAIEHYELIKTESIKRGIYNYLGEYPNEKDSCVKEGCSIYISSNGEVHYSKGLPNATIFTKYVMEL